MMKITLLSFTLILCRFRHKGIYLRDAYTFEDYKLLDSSVIKMVPMAKSKNELLNAAVNNTSYSLKGDI